MTQTLRRQVRHRAGPQNAGFTLIELLIVITVMGVLLVVVVPSFKNASLNSQLRAIANNVVASTMLARSEAFKRNAIVTMCVSTDGLSCGAGGWEQGWIVTSSGAVLQHQEAAPSGYKVTPSGGITSFTFQPTGAGTTSGTLTICRAQPDVGASKREVNIDARGRSSVTQLSTTVCS